MIAPERIEVACDDHGLARALHQLVQMAQLIVAMAEFQREVHEEDRHFLQLQLDDEPLDAGLEVVKALAFDARRGEKRIALLAHDRHQLIDGRRAVLALIRRVVTERVGDLLRLVDQARADRAGIDLDQPDEVRDPATSGTA